MQNILDLDFEHKLQQKIIKKKSNFSLVHNNGFRNEPLFRRFSHSHYKQ
jgi:hypothetical protein